LTPRETQVLRLLADGQKNKTIGLRLSISENTVRAHVRSVMQKLRVMNRVQAAKVAMSVGLASTRGDDDGNLDS
jgi:DNA-binding NarL/FixJ family response regulator